MDETTTAEKAPSKGRGAAKKPAAQKPAQPKCTQCGGTISAYDRDCIHGACGRCTTSRSALAEMVLPTLIRTGLAVEPTAAAKLAMDFAEAFIREGQRSFGGTP